ncbi:hypothetical protein BH10BAC5_BH10BAC5_22630 [soil metagenome]
MLASIVYFTIVILTIRNLRTEFKYSLITAVLYSVWIISRYYLGYNTYDIVGDVLYETAGLIFLIGGISLSIREKKNKTGNGSISYGEALKTGFAVTVFSSLLIMVFTFIYYKFVNPDFFTIVMASTKQKLMDSDLSVAQRNTSIESMEKTFSIGMQMLQKFSLVMVGGLSLTLIIAWLLSEKELKNSQPVSHNA